MNLFTLPVWQQRHWMRKNRRQSRIRWVLSGTYEMKKREKKTELSAHRCQTNGHKIHIYPNRMCRPHHNVFPFVWAEQPYFIAENRMEEHKAKRNTSIYHTVHRRATHSTVAYRQQLLFSTRTHTGQLLEANAGPRWKIHWPVRLIPFERPTRARDRAKEREQRPKKRRKKTVQKLN